MNDRTVNQDRHFSPSAVVHESTSKSLLFVCALLTGLSLGGTAWALSMAFRAQERADLAQLEVESFKNVLHSRRLPTSVHLEGEAP